MRLLNYIVQAILNQYTLDRDHSKNGAATRHTINFPAIDSRGLQGGLHRRGGC